MSDIKTIKDFIRRDLVVFSPEMQISEAVARLLALKISGAPVVDDTGTLVGIITAKDCFRTALTSNYYQGWYGVVADFMSTNVETLDAELDLFSAAERFLNTNFRRFPVLQDDQLLGVVTRFDLLLALNKQWN